MRPDITSPGLVTSLPRDESKLSLALHIGTLALSDTRSRLLPPQNRLVVSPKVCGKCDYAGICECAANSDVYEPAQGRKRAVQTLLAITIACSGRANLATGACLRLPSHQTTVFQNSRRHILTIPVQ